MRPVSAHKSDLDLPLEPGDKGVIYATCGVIGAVLLGALVLAVVLMVPGCTIAGEPCGTCPRGQVCGAGRCVPERVAVPSPGGPL